MQGLVRRDRGMGMLEAGRGLTDVVKVVTGMRRSGKSTLLAMYREELVSAGVDPSDIISLNLETFEHLHIRSSDALNRELMERIGGSGRKYVFIDGIQNVDGWEESVSALVNTGRCDIYITGSNSRMLSSDLVTHISGRFVEIPLLPLSFSEYLELHPGDPTERFGSYLRFGALPEVDPKRGEAFCDSQLTGIFNTVMVEDVLGRMGPADAKTLKAVTRFLFENIGDPMNVDSVAKALGIGNDTARRYLDGLTDASLIYHSERYDVVGRRVLKTNGRYYASDLGLRNAALLGAGGTDPSGPLENVVYLELLRRGYTVRTGSFRDREVDFTAVRGGATEYYQVCLTMMSEGIRDRELRSLASIRDNHRKTVLTLDRLGLGDEDGIRVVNVLDWLMDGSRPVFPATEATRRVTENTRADRIPASALVHGAGEGMGIRTPRSITPRFLSGHMYCHEHRRTLADVGTPEEPWDMLDRIEAT